jgi:hypothetical protein
MERTTKVGRNNKNDGKSTNEACNKSDSCLSPSKGNGLVLMVVLLPVSNCLLGLIVIIFQVIPVVNHFRMGIISVQAADKRKKRSVNARFSNILPRKEEDHFW